MHRHHVVRDTGDLPVPEPSRRPRVRLDCVTQLYGDACASQAADHGGGVQVLPPQRRVGCFPPGPLILHSQEVGQQNVVVRARVTCPGGGVAGAGVDEPACGRSLSGLAAAATHFLGDLVEVRHCRVRLGVHDLVHCLRPAHHPQLGDALMG